MPAITNVFSIEDNIATQLLTVSDIDKIYREAVTEGLNEENIEAPSLFIANKGFQAGQAVGNASSQKVTTLWEIGVVCKKVDYKTVGGEKIIQVMKQLNGYKAPDWIKPARLLQDNNKTNEPQYEGSLAYFPLLFAIEIII